MFYDVREFAITRLVQQQFPVIREELLKLPNRKLDGLRHWDRQRHFETIRSNNGWMETQNHPTWFTYIVCCNGQFPDDARQAHPRITELLASQRGILQCGFSLFRPQTIIVPHIHAEYVGADVLSAHLAIFADPQTSYLCVGGLFEEEVPGKALAFDGTVQHFAFNASTQHDRVILYLEFEKSAQRTAA